MQIKPVTKANKPEYPTASEIDIPKVLNASKPNKWKRNVAIGAVMVGMLFGSGGCKKDKDIKLTSVAPLFKHGRYVAMTEGMYMSSPSFINEIEAKQIVCDELNTHGLSSDTNKNDSLELFFYRNLPWSKNNRIYSFMFNGYIESDEMINRIYKYYLERKKKSEPIRPEEFYSTKLHISAYADNYKIAIILLDSSSCIKFHDPIETFGGRRVIINFKQNIDKVRNSWLKTDTMLVTFYTPISVNGYEEGSKKWIKEFNKSKDSLRAQVRDFLKWYKENKGKK